MSFDVEQGEIFTIIGPNGAGKTTIFNLISRILRAVRRRSLSTAATSQRAGASGGALGIARTFQNIELFENASVLQNILLGRHAHKHRAAREIFLPSVRRRRWSIARRSRR